MEYLAIRATPKIEVFSSAERMGGLFDSELREIPNDKLKKILEWSLQYNLVAKHNKNTGDSVASKHDRVVLPIGKSGTQHKARRVKAISRVDQAKKNQTPPEMVEWMTMISKKGSKDGSEPAKVPKGRMKTVMNKHNAWPLSRNLIPQLNPLADKRVIKPAETVPHLYRANQA